MTVLYIVIHGQICLVSVFVERCVALCKVLVFAVLDGFHKNIFQGRILREDGAGDLGEQVQPMCLLAV